MQDKKPESQPGRIRQRLGHDTDTWKAFETYFFLPLSRYPLEIKGLTQGQAINLTQGLNRCNIQFADEQGMPDEAILLSAKAKRDQGGAEAGEEAVPSGWLVEISKNWRRTGEKPAGAKGISGWLADSLAQTCTEFGIDSLETIAAREAEQALLWKKREEARHAAPFAAYLGEGRLYTKEGAEGAAPTQEELLENFMKGDTE